MSDVATSGDLWLRDAVGHEVGAVLTKDEAHDVTAKIKAYAGVAWILLLEAHNRQAHKAMGYASWSDYVLAEFDMSRSRSYQLISQAKVIIELTEAVSTDVDIDVSTLVDISEAEARDLAPVIDEAKAAVTEATEALHAEATPQDVEAAVRASLDATRAAIVAKRRPKVEPEAPRREAGDASEEALVAHSGSLTEEGGMPSATGSGAGEDVAPGQTREASSPSSSTCPTCGGSGTVAA